MISLRSAVRARLRLFAAPPLAPFASTHPMTVTLHPACIRGALTPPSSKSYAQRALAAALLACGESLLCGVDPCDDTRAALRCIRTLGARVERLDEATLRIAGGLAPVGERLYAGESGLAARIFAPIAALCDRPLRIEGAGSLRQRPMTPLVGPLRALGAEVGTCAGAVPLTLRGPLRGGEATVDGSLSSQFLSGLLLALPLAPNDSLLHLHGAVSRPYIGMTLDTLRAFGIAVDRCGYETFRIPGGQRYAPCRHTVERDWSAAATLLVAGATAGEVTLRGLAPDSRQADRAVLAALERAGAAVDAGPHGVTAARRPLRGFRFDATECPDLFPALVALAAAAEGETLLRGVLRLRHKESDRGAALAAEYGRLGVAVDFPEADCMRIRGGGIRGGRVSGHGDHRIVMSLAVAALRADGPVEIEGAEAVGKSYPRFFDDLNSIRI